jgi:hypothetical protein
MQIAMRACRDIVREKLGLAGVMTLSRRRFGASALQAATLAPSTKGLGSSLEIVAWLTL